MSDGQMAGQEETPAQQQARMSASSATRELDELMASLSDFKVQSNVSTVLKWVDFGSKRFAHLIADVSFWHCLQLCCRCLGVCMTFKLIVEMHWMR